MLLEAELHHQPNKSNSTSMHLSQRRVPRRRSAAVLRHIAVIARLSHHVQRGTAIVPAILMGRAPVAASRAVGGCARLQVDLVVHERLVRQDAALRVNPRLNSPPLLGQCLAAVLSGKRQRPGTVLLWVQWRRLGGSCCLWRC